MADSQNSIAPYHTRSISLPSRSHLFVPEFAEQLRRLRSSEAASTSSSSLSHKLSGLRDLYDCIDKLLQLQLNRQMLNQNREAKWVDDLLDGSLRLLDVCSTARDVLSQIKECIQDIQSAFRRRCSGEMSINSEVSKYVDTRKKVKRTMKKCFIDIKSMQSKNDGGVAIVCMLREVEAVTVQIFEPLLCYIAGPKMQSKKTSWFTASKLMNRHKVGDEAEKEACTSEFEHADATLTSLLSSKKKSGIVQADQLRTQMTQMESSIQDLDEQLECLFRAMVKTRAAFLNILSN
ncbi:hypothetical protein Ancab_028155 [Ancistrocladus abbreviatus]